MAARFGAWRVGGWLALVMVTVAACGRPTGDFGRAEPSFLHDTILPVAGSFVAAQARKPMGVMVTIDPGLRVGWTPVEDYFQ